MCMYDLQLKIIRQKIHTIHVNQYSVIIMEKHNTTIH